MKTAEHNRIVHDRIERVERALRITVAPIHISDGDAVRLSWNWVRVHLDELLALGDRLAACEARVVEAEEERSRMARELAEACEELAALHGLLDALGSASGRKE